ncbi:uncharacterized protein LOC119078595 isoform X2 [Bradysia coprophila]|uniref:uncharacterized protein LOC119078595 isoform X2 n=1 Tax=Bradysia coprophila TaxID=38358 RepID=UPI00187DC4EE|nr:uncharacterized protein LOC119078595 isoform X2 [Bradysia coprophila]
MDQRQKSRGLGDSINKCYSIYYENEQNGQATADQKLDKHPRKREPHKSWVGSVDAEENLKMCQSEYKPEDNNNQDTTSEIDRKRRLSGDSVDIPMKDEVFYKKLKYDATKDLMYQAYQPWVIKTYGDMAKTKTITIKKHERIVKALSGLEQNKPDSSKFRFWVKAKGFTTERPHNFKEVPPFHQSNEPNNGIHLYIPNLTKEPGIQPYRKVAVVEQFFDIIYNVHVGLGGRSSRHAGQKRTYRTITESYAFLPRDAVTKFLAGCQFCKKNSKPHSPSSLIADDVFTESSSETDALNAGSGIFSENSDSQLTIDSSTTDAKITDNSKAMDPFVIKKEDEMNNLSVVDWEEAITLEKNRVSAISERNSNSMQMIEQMNGAQQKTYFDEIYTKIQQYYGYQINNNADMKDLAASNDLLNYYTILKTFYDQSVAAHKLETKTGESRALLSAQQTSQNKCNQLKAKDEPATTSLSEPIIDLTISRPEEFKNNININIENGSTTSTNSTVACTNSNEPSENNITINSAGVSINVLNNSKELKISCKTTPPKKRYSVYNHTEDNTSSKVNLNERFNQDSVTHKTTENMVAEYTIGKELQTTSRADNTFFSRKYSTPTNDVKPITSTYLQLMRSMGFCDEDALKFDHLEPIPTATGETSEPQHIEDAYSGLMKDADKLKLMLLAWNYQNSNAVRNGTEGPDLGMVGGLWAQYQNALALNNPVKLPPSSPPRVDQSMNSPSIENPDETSSSGQKDDDGSEDDDSDDRLDQNTHDPERLKAFNMFVRLFVDENLDRMIPISKQPKEKIQAIIDSCTRQFPEFSERARKRIRTYLKSCRRNKKTREGWETTSRPTPAHLTSVQAEQLLAIACENESMNAKRMRIGLDPISQSAPQVVTTQQSSENTGNSITYPLGFKTSLDSESIPQTNSITALPKTTNITSLSDTKPLLGLGSSITNGNVGLNNTSLYRTDIASTAAYTTRAELYQSYLNNTALTTNAPTDLSMKQQQQQQQQHQTLQTLQPQQPQQQQMQQQPTNRPPILSHKLNSSEITAVRQLVTGYRESAAFLLRSADELEQLLLNQQ